MKETVFTDDQIAMVEALAEAIIPGDETGGGVADLSPGYVIATRVRYQPEIADIYLKGLKGVEDSVAIMFGTGRKLTDLSIEERSRLLQAMRRDVAPGAAWRNVSSQKFYLTLRSDVCFIYTTDPEVCKRIGFLGRSALEGGYPDFADPQ